MWSLTEARAALPDVRHRLAEAQRVLERLQYADGEVKALLEESEGAAEEPGHVLHDELLSRRDDGRGARQALEGVLAWFDTEGILVKSLQPALIDFPGRAGDQVVLLCWREGEATVAHWHPVDAGFAGRRPVPEPMVLEA